MSSCPVPHHGFAKPIYFSISDFLDISHSRTCVLQPLHTHVQAENVSAVIGRLTEQKAPLLSSLENVQYLTAPRADVYQAITGFLAAVLE